MRRRILSVLRWPGCYFMLLASVISCDERVNPGSPTPAPSVTDDVSLWRHVSQVEPFASYALFPNTDEFTSGTLNGSEAHRTIVRVTLNARAAGALQNGKLPSGGRFPNGSTIFKELRPSIGAPASGYAVMFKDSSNPLAANGWMWAMFSPSGEVTYALSNRGSTCTGCHLWEQGAQNDSVRTFERQR